MKNLLSLLLCSLLLFGCSDKYDDSALRNDLDNLENRIAKVEELCKQMNTNISSLQKIVDALQNKLSILKVEPISDGYIIHFSDGTAATIKNGKNADPVPVIGVQKDADGIYYWTLNGKWLTDAQGNKIKAQGTDGAKGDTGDKGDTGNTGAKGDTGVTPQLKIENDYWFVSYDNGQSWTKLGKATGENGKDGTNGIFKSVTEDDNNVYFTMTNGTIITIPKGDNSQFALAFDTTDVAILHGGASKTISYTIAGATENTIVKALAQDGWKAVVNATSTDKGTITVTAPDPIVESEILVFANDGAYRTVMASLNCMQGQINIADNSVQTAPAGGAQEVRLTTNLDYTIEIPEEAKSWLSLAPETRAMRDDTIVFTVAANEGIQRFATVALKDEQGNTLQTIIFRQLGICNEVHVETKGELEKVLADYDYAHIESLKITGVLNDVDFLFIYRMMPNLKNLDIAEVNITALPTQAFYQSKNVEHLILPNTLTTIGKEMFYQSNLETVIIPVNVETIELSAFSGCRALTSIEIPASVETIEATAFQGCSKLTTVTFEKSSKLKTIGGGYYDDKWCGAFSDCPIVSIEIPANVETIEAAAFKGCSELTTVIFEKDSKLKTIGGGYKYYDDYYGAFCELKKLMTVDMSACTRVQSIGKYAFYGDFELRLFKIGTIIPPVCVEYAFEGINPYSVLKVPSGCADAYKDAEGWKEFASITGLDE